MFWYPTNIHSHFTMLLLLSFTLSLVWTACSFGWSELDILVWSPLVLLSGFSSRRVLRIVTQGPSSAWLCQQSAVAVKTQTWISCLPSSPKESSNTRNGWVPPASVACRKALGAWQHKCRLTQDEQGVQLVSLLRKLHQLSTIIEEVGVNSPFQAVVG